MLGSQPNLAERKRTPTLFFLPNFTFLPSSVHPREPKPLSARSRQPGRRNQRGKDWVKKQRVEKERGKSSFHRQNFFVCEPICTKFATRLEEAQTHLPTNFQLSPFLGSPARAETTLPRAQAGLGAGFSGRELGKGALGRSARENANISRTMASIIMKFDTRLERSTRQLGTESQLSSSSRLAVARVCRKEGPDRP